MTVPPQVRLELRVGRSAELVQQFEMGNADVLICMRTERMADEIAVISEPTRWLVSSAGFSTRRQDEVPLALLDAPCGFRVMALAALEQAGRRYRITATSPSLVGLRTAVSSGIATTLRTKRWQRQDLAPAPLDLRLPTTDPVVFAIRLRPGAAPEARDFAELLTHGLGGPN